MERDCPDRVNISYHGPEADSILCRSASLWQHALRQAKSMTGIPPISVDLEGVLSRTPSLPVDIPQCSTSIKGYSTWKNLDPSCRLLKTERIRSIELRKYHHTTCLISPSRNFLHWEGKPNNGITLLVMGWAYILSANLAERQNLRMEYNPLRNSCPSPALIHLNYAKPQELAWWKAIVSPGIGWSIADGQISPWAVRVDNIGLGIGGEADVDQQPPTAREAARYLARLCHAYDLGSQCSAALAAALTLPLHANAAPFKPATIELPQPSFPAPSASPGEPDCPTEFDHLGYYMSLSLCPWIIGPALWSTFWEPQVPCNFAGAWLGPITSVLGPIISDNNLELLAKVLSFTKIAPLWLGLAICGRRAIVSTILPSLAQLHDYPHARPDVDSAAWTGVPQSFMHIHLPGPYLRNGLVTRADVWRLRHDCNREYKGDTFAYSPAYGWPPFGEMRAADVELEIRGHLQCSHQWQYAWWTWSQNSIIDAGFRGSPTVPPLEQMVIDVNRQDKVFGENLCEVSKIATKSVFWWCSNQVEKGFGGSLVEHRHGSDVALKESKRVSLDREAIERWIAEIGPGRANGG